jgi:hypothetical protein
LISPAADLFTKIKDSPGVGFHFFFNWPTLIIRSPSTATALFSIGSPSMEPQSANE